MTVAQDPRQRILQAIAGLPDGVRKHIEEVRMWSVQLAEAHGADVSKAELAAVSHDICRTVPTVELLSMARKYGISVTDIDEAFPVFLHGPIGAEVLCRTYGLHDEEVLQAVACHTMGKAHMTTIDKVIFLADKMDSGKMTRYPFIAEVSRLAKTDLNEALLCFVDYQVKNFLSHGDLIHPSMIVARNEAILAKKRQPGQ